LQLPQGRQEAILIANRSIDDYNSTDCHNHFTYRRSSFWPELGCGLATEGCPIALARLEGIWKWFATRRGKGDFLDGNVFFNSYSDCVDCKRNRICGLGAQEWWMLQ
jgi:hypothetical protein